jgi:SEC-C motif-containing protein
MPLSENGSVDPCPCGFGEPYDQCCGRYHRGVAEPPTATVLMRARYSAFAVGDAAFLRRTGPLPTQPADGLIDPSVTWTGLFITGSTAGGLLDDRGTVEFTARFVRRNDKGTLRENSRFVRVDGRWSYAGSA